MGPEGVATRHDGLVEVARLRQALAQEIFAEERKEVVEWEDDIVDAEDEEMVVLKSGDRLGGGMDNEEEEKRVGDLLEEIIGERERTDEELESEMETVMEKAGFI